MNLKKLKDPIYPMSIDFSSFNSEIGSGYEIKIDAFERITPKEPEDIETLSGSHIHNITKSTEFERSLCIRAGLGGNIPLDDAYSTLDGKIGIDDIVSKSRKTIYCSVLIEIPKKKIRLKKEKIKVTAHFETELMKIINDNSTYPDFSRKVNALYKKIRDNYGFIVPLSITYGGKFEFVFESTTEADKKSKVGTLELAFKDFEYGEGNSSLIINKTIIDKISKTGATIDVIGGGEKLVLKFEDIKEWANSLSIENYGIIAFENLRLITDEDFYSEKTLQF